MRVLPHSFAHHPLSPSVARKTRHIRSSSNSSSSRSGRRRERASDGGDRSSNRTPAKRGREPRSPSPSEADECTQRESRKIQVNQTQSGRHRESERDGGGRESPSLDILVSHTHAGRGRLVGENRISASCRVFSLSTSLSCTCLLVHSLSLASSAHMLYPAEAEVCCRHSLPLILSRSRSLRAFSVSHRVERRTTLWLPD